MSIIDKMLAIVIRNLETVGAKYRIIMPDGDSHTNIVEEEAPVAAPPKRKRSVPHKTYHNVYYPIVSVMEPGAYAGITVPEGLDAERLRGCICAWTAKHWGNGASTTTLGRGAHGYTIQILRIEELV